MAQPPGQSFRLTRSQRGAEKLTEGDYCYGKQRRVGDVTHWLCERRGICRAIIHTQGMEILKRTNEHLHAPDEQAVSCCEVKVGMKRKARDSQDSSHHIVGEGLETVTEGTAAQAGQSQAYYTASASSSCAACYSRAAHSTGRVQADF